MNVHAFLFFVFFQKPLGADLLCLIDREEFSRQTKICPQNPPRKTQKYSQSLIASILQKVKYVFNGNKKNPRCLTSGLHVHIQRG